MKTKDPMQLRLEHLEQGFTVYVNGANSELKTSPRKAVHSDFTRSASHAEGTHGEHRTPWAQPHTDKFGTVESYPMHINLPASS